MAPARSDLLVATVLDPQERPRLDAAVQGRFQSVHTETVGEVIRAVRERPVNAVLLSPRRVGSTQMAGVASLVRGFPGVPTVAVLSHHDGESSERLLEFGACGVRRAVDLSRRNGWGELRSLVEDPASPTGSRILARTIPALGTPSPDCQYFFESLIRLAPGVTTVRELARRLCVTPSTLSSRFFRAKMPSPKRHLVAVRLVYSAGLLETPGLSIADVSYRLEYSSPQSFGRHLKTGLGVTAAEFRKRFSFETALDDFVARLIVPYRQCFHQFRPLEHGVTDLGHSW